MTTEQFMLNLVQFYGATYNAFQRGEVIDWLLDEVPDYLYADLWKATRKIKLYGKQPLPLIAELAEALEEAKENYRNTRPPSQAPQIEADAGDPILPPEEVAQRLAALPFRVPIGNFDLRRQDEA